MFYLQLKLFYDEDASNLNLTVVGAESLAPKETTTPPNPYVRIYFLPDKRYAFFFSCAMGDYNKSAAKKKNNK